MKTNIIANNTVINAIMKKYIKYLCAVLMIIGTSVHAWGAGINVKYPNSGAGQTSYYNGQTITINLELVDGMACGASSIDIKNDAGWSASSYYYGYIHCTISGTYVYSNVAFVMGSLSGNNCSPYWDDEAHYTGFSTWNNSNISYMTVNVGYCFDAAGTYNSTITVVQKDDADASTLQSATITIRYVVTASCTTPTVAFADAGPLYKKTTASSFTNAATAKVGGSSTGQTITYSSNNTSVATVNPSTGAVTLKGVVGSATITATAAAKSTYCEKTATYTINVYDAPTVNNTNLAVSNITPTSATVVGGQVSNRNGRDITQYGWLINTSSTVDKDNYVKVGGYNANPSLNTNFASKSVTGLTAGTTYYVRPYATNGAYGYGPSGTIVSFTTPYEITLDKNGGSSNGSAYVVPNATSLTNISAPTRTGYSVEGYYTTGGVATKVATAAGALQASITVSATTWTNGSNQWKRGAGETFYAKWTPKEYYILFDTNGGTGGSEDVTATYNADMPSITPPTPPSGKEFVGYFYEETKYYNADGTSAHVWDIDDEVILTASYTTSTPTMTIKSVDHVVISSTTPSKFEGQSGSVTYNSTVTLSHGAPESGYNWGGWNVYETGNTGNTVTVTNNQFTMPDFDVTVSAWIMSDYVFSCASLSLTGPAGDVVYITSTAGKTVRSQEAFHVTGTGLTASTALDFSFGNDDLNAVFEFKLADGSAPTTSSSGAIDADIYVYYTPSESTDGLDKATNLTVSMAGGKPKQATLNTKTVVGRHLPEDFVIAAKRNNKWYALPSSMTVDQTARPVEIAVDDADNPTIAYTTTSNMYTLYDQNGGQGVKLAMQGIDNAPLASSPTSSGIGKSSATIVTNPQENKYLWIFAQTNTDITNAKNAKYTMKSLNPYSDYFVRLKENAGNPIWGQYSTGITELRLIPAREETIVEAEVVEWGADGLVIEVDAAAISANKVIAKLNGSETPKMTLNQTLTSGKGRATAYNYTINFGILINLAANASFGKILMLEWYNDNTLVGVTSIEVPKIIKSESSVTMSSIESQKTEWAKWEVHILPGTTLEANLGSFSSGGAIRELHIYPGATLKVTTASYARTITIDSLILRNGWTRVGEKRYDVARLYLQPEIDGSHKAASLVHTKAYLDWYIDYDQYYPIGLPWPVTTNAITYKNSNTAASAGVKIRYYDGSKRAESGKTGQSWIEYTWGGTMPSTLTPSTGYALTAKRPSGKAFAIVRMPLTFTNEWTTAGEQGDVSPTHKDQVSVSANSGSLAWYTQGWNFVANPYMYDFSGNTDGVKNNLVDQSGTNYRYATIPDVDFQNFDQVNITSATLAPASGFFVQVASNTTLTFSNSGIVTPSAPARYTNEPEAVPDQEAYILLSNETGAKDQMGLIIGWDYTAEYEINADLAKILAGGNALKTYMQYGGTEMAYVAINEVLAREWIPVTVYIPAAGEYTYSLQNSSTVDELEGLYLIDYLTGTTTNLLFDEYTFTAEEGTLGERFAINAIVGDHKVPTGADVTGLDKDSNGPIKFIWHDKVFILHGNVIYDSTGKRVSVINK